MNSSGNEKFKQLDKKAGIRNPFKAPKGIDERLAKIGMSKNEAMSLSKIPVSNAESSNIGSSKSKTGNQPNHKGTHASQSPETFLYDKSFWNKITPEHREGIRVKYGIKNETPTPNKLYQPLPRSERRSLNLSQNKIRTTTSKPIHKFKKESQRPLRNKNIGARNEI